MILPWSTPGFRERNWGCDKRRGVKRPGLRRGKTLRPDTGSDPGATRVVWRTPGTCRSPAPPPGGIRGSRRQRLRCSPDPPAATRNFPSAAAAGALEQRRGRWIKYKTSFTSGLSRPKSPRSCCAEARLGRGRAVPCQPGGSGLPPTPPHYCRAYAPRSGRTGGGWVSPVRAARARAETGTGHGQPQRPARTPTGPPPRPALWGPPA